jgi:hypothetical protein
MRAGGHRLAHPPRPRGRGDERLVPDNDGTSGWLNVVNNASSNAAEGVYPHVPCADT